MSLRPIVWWIHIALPLLGLWLLIEQPGADVEWEDHTAHLWVVVAPALLNMWLALRIGRESRERGDARLLLVSLAFLSAAGFLALHAVATPQTVLSGPNAGFVLATPVGLVVAGAIAAISALPYPPAVAERIVRASWFLYGLVALALAAWALISLAELPPLDEPVNVEEARGELKAVAAVGCALYLMAALGYWRVHRRRPAVMLIGVITAFALLAEALVAVAYARSWHASWWEWHVLMGIAFGFVAYSAHVHHRRGGDPAGLFSALSLEETVRRIRQEHGAALEALVDDMRAGRPSGRAAAGVAERFGLSEAQAAVLEQAAGALAAERDQIRRLDALVEIGSGARVMLPEEQLLQRAVAAASSGFEGDALRVGLVEGGALRFPADLTRGEFADDRLAQAALDRGEPVGNELAMALPLTAKRNVVGMLELQRGGGRTFATRDRNILVSLADQLSIALENARLYRQLDVLFKQYMSPEVATALIADPSQAALGGAVLDVTVLFADLRGYTAFTEKSDPESVVALLNELFGSSVPHVLAEGGTVIEFAGDALMAVFGAPARQRDHPVRAARAALTLQEATGRIAAARGEGTPRFRVGLATGAALVGNIGSEERRKYTVVGDIVNLAARLEQNAPVGAILIAPSTLAALGDRAVVEEVAPLVLKGKAEPVPAVLLTGLR